MTNKNILEIKNKNLHFQTLKKIEEIKKNKIKKGYTNFNSYKINIFLKKLFDILKDFDNSIKSTNDIELTFVDRNKFDADLCIKIPTLLQKFKGQYGKEIVPKIINLLDNSSLKKDSIISKVLPVGIYINISLTNKYLFDTLKDIFDKGNKYGENDIHKGESIIVDYSSPNVAKHLHAGHIRSTIIGHVLANLYDVNGYFTHRINHINDWGGFGFLIEGFLRWQDKLENFENKNDMLFYIYTLYRKGEKISKSKEEYDKLSTKDLEELKKYYGSFSNYEDFCLLFKDFLKSGKEKFSLLENGEKQEVELWEQMVSWSMEDFEKFYNLLGIHHDYVLGESFYSDYGVKLIEDLEKKGDVVLYNQDLANKDIIKLNELLKQEKIKEKSFEILKEEILRDIGAYVINLENLERFVVLKSNKSSIYATRDLGAIKYRNLNFQPNRIIYEVGQEQSEHFDKLFKSAKKIGINGVSFSHVYHGFYVDSKTKKKLSSRDGASNVQKLINNSIQFFKDKYKDSDFSENDINDIAYKLAIGSIIFNDIKSDKKNPVFISNDIKESCETFEESGGAYVMYSIIRAKSILSRIDNLEKIKFNDIEIENLDNIEKIIINEINKYPLIIKQAQENDNPAILVEFILNLCRYYNSYYNSHRVIVGDKIVEYRIFLTKAFIIIATNAMNICHIKIPNKI